MHLVGFIVRKVHSLSVVELHVAVNCVRTSSAAQQCVYAQFYVTGNSAVIRTRF